MSNVSVRPSDAIQGRVKEFSGIEKVGRFILNNGLLFALIAEIIFFSFALPKGQFFTVSNFMNTLQIIGGGGIAAICFTVALIGGVIDFSIGNVCVMSGLLFAYLYAVVGLPMGVAGLISLAVVLIFEWVNCFLMIKLRIFPLVATLAVGFVALGVATALMAAAPEPGFMRLHDKTLWTLANSKLGGPAGFPVITIVALVVFAILYVIMTQTKLGAHIYAMGGNRYIARLYGIQVDRITVGLMTMVGVASFVVAVYMTGRAFYASTANIIRPDPFLAALFAGVGLYGGAGKLERTLLALLFLGFMVTGMALKNYDPTTREIVNGMSFIAAILLESIRQHFENR